MLTETTYPLHAATRRARIPKKTYKALRAFTVLSYFAVLFYLILEGEKPGSILGAILITTAATIPVLIWYSLPERGLPIFPIFAVPFVWCYATPLVIGHKMVDLYSSSDHLYASLAISGFLVISTIAWRLSLQIKQRKTKLFYRFLQHQYKPILFVVMFGALLFHGFERFGIISLPFGFHVIIRTGIEVAQSLAVFVLGYMWGSKALKNEEKLTFFLCAIGVCYIQCLSFILFAPVAKVVILVAAITLGARKFPAVLATFVLPMFIVLHFGKYEMRAKYWYGEGSKERLEITDVPMIFMEWYQHSFNYLIKNREDTPPERISSDGSHFEDRRFTERLSLMHMFLEVQERAGTEVPYFYGKSYLVIPKSLVPRVIYPGKVSPHESMYIINIEYGHQTREHIRTTHKAWGLLAEAWANFGPLGLVLLGISMGVTLGLLTVYTRNYPLLSFRGCLAALLCTATISANATTLAVLVSSVLHSVVILLAITFIWMKPGPRDSSTLE